MYTPTPINLLTAPIHRQESTTELCTPQTVQTPPSPSETTPQLTGNATDTLLDGDKGSVVNAIGSNTGSSTHNATPTLHSQNSAADCSTFNKTDNVPSLSDTLQAIRTNNRPHTEITGGQSKNVLPNSAQSNSSDLNITPPSRDDATNNHSIICDSDNELNPISPNGSPEKVTPKLSSYQASIPKVESIGQSSSLKGTQRLIPELTPKARSAPDPTFLKMEDVQKLLTGQTRLHSSQQHASHVKSLQSTSPVPVQQGVTKTGYVPSSVQSPAGTQQGVTKTGYVPSSMQSPAGTQQSVAKAPYVPNNLQSSVGTQQQSTIKATYVPSSQQSPATSQQGTIKATYVPSSQHSVSTVSSPLTISKVIVSQKVTLGSEANRELLRKLNSPGESSSGVKTQKILSPSTPLGTPYHSTVSSLKSETSAIATTPKKITLGSAKNAELLQKLLPPSSRSQVRTHSPSLLKPDANSSSLKSASSTSGNVSIVPQFGGGKVFFP